MTGQQTNKNVHCSDAISKSITEKKPKRALTAYDCYFRYEISKIPGICSRTLKISGGVKKHTQCKANKEKEMQQINRNISDKWKTLDKCFREVFETQSTLDTERYEQEVEEYQSRCKAFPNLMTTVSRTSEERSTDVALQKRKYKTMSQTSCTQEQQRMYIAENDENGFSIKKGEDSKLEDDLPNLTTIDEVSTASERSANSVSYGDTISDVPHDVSLPYYHFDGYNEYSRGRQEHGARPGDIYAEFVNFDDFSNASRNNITSFSKQVGENVRKTNVLRPLKKHKISIDLDDNHSSLGVSYNADNDLRTFLGEYVIGLLSDLG